MATDVMMPRLSDSMEEGTVLKWLVEVGGEVKRGEPLVEIETDKANMTYEADSDGVLIEVLAQEGETLPIGQVIARVGAAGEEVAGGRSQDAGNGAQATEEPATETEEEAPAAEEQPASEQAPATRDPRPATSGGEAAGGNGRVKASPVARRMAREMGLELAGIEGSGPGGRIVKADVEAVAQGGGTALKERPAEEEPRKEQAPATRDLRPATSDTDGAKGEVRIQELTRLQRTVSRRMAESKATAPEFQLNMEIDMSGCVELRARLKEVADPAPSFNDMVVKAAANALTEYPRVNGAYRDGQWELYSRVNVGVAVAAQDTLIVPTIFDADKKSLGAIARDARDVITKVREGSITPPELSGGTFTVSNLGMYGIENFTAIINPPQAAILAVGALKKKAVVDDAGRVVARDMMGVTLICDHRILYGADGAEFLARVRQLLESPFSLAL
ncbi:MAG TPA: dihydrolipoamide acetyltransferase family protein [Thermoleophilaceae bacterium]|jgi:pyruvate dehydrogenase E2 component (dihydrolipoamide acetyltransferase)